MAKIVNQIIRLECFEFFIDFAVNFLENVAIYGFSSFWKESSSRRTFCS